MLGSQALALAPLWYLQTGLSLAKCLYYLLLTNQPKNCPFDDKDRFIQQIAHVR